VSAPGHRHTCIHIGLPKTAMTTVRQFLFAHHPDIHYLGRWIGSRRTYRSHDVRRMVAAIRAARATASEVAPFREQVRTMGQSPLVRNKTVVLSDESFVMGSLARRRRRAELLSSVFQPARVMITLRRPEALVESLYFQKIANEQLNGRRCFGKPLEYVGIEEWLEANWARSEGGALASLDYARTIEAFAEVFGKEALGVFLLEQLAQDTDAYYRAICRFIGVDERHGLALAGHKRVNTRPARQAVLRMREVSESKLRSFLFRWSPGVVRRRMVGATPDDVAGPRTAASAQIPEPWRQRLVDLTREGNRRLVAEFGVPLDQFGYPT
jgi:hypothetical protein